jgi:hemerythrin-like domain-containing protein
MMYSKPIQMLVDEHAVILSVLDAVEAAALGDAEEFPGALYEKAFDFFAVFADRCHHAKEEKHLFPLLVRRGIPQEDGPIGCMLSEHEIGRRHVAAARAALPRALQGDAPARQTVRREALAYVELLRQHIMKENQVLFMLGDQSLTPQDKDDLWAQFQCAEHGAVPPGTHEKYLALAEALRRPVGA